MRTSPPPARAPRPGRADEVVAAARLVLERDGADGLTMRSVADVLQIKAPSLYKHVAGKGAIEVELIALVLEEMGQALHDALDAAPDGNGRGGSDDDHDGDRRRIAALLAAYRRHALAHPDLYRLATTGRLPRDGLPPGLEDWSGQPFVTVTGDEDRGRALWSFAHGMVVLELDDRYPVGAALDEAWAAGAAAFAAIVTGARAPAGRPTAGAGRPPGGVR